MDRDDRILIGRILGRRDQRAYTELVNRYQSRLRYSLRQLTGWDEALADDLAQETFINAFKNLSSFKGDSQFYTWLYSIAYRVFANHYRSQRSPGSLADNAVDSEIRLGMTADELHRDLAKSLAQLSPEQAAGLHLHLHCEFTHSEIADIMNLPLGTVKSHIQRGKDRLRDLLSAWNTNASCSEPV